MKSNRDAVSACRISNDRGARASIVAGFHGISRGTLPAITVGMRRDDPQGIDERSFRFYADVLAFVDTIPLTPKTTKLVEQLTAAAGSIGSNREEALGASSRREFLRYSEIVLRGANESARWLRACAATRLGDRDRCLQLLDEARQLAKIAAKIVITTKRKGLGPDPGPSPNT